MSPDPTPACPFSGAPAGTAPLLDGYDRRWDLSRDAEFLRPQSSSDHENLAETAKTAWRNSVRCIGRRMWKGLEVVDARELSRADDIFEALLCHLRQATNKGKIVPVMSVFREWQPDEPEIRIWNHQLIRYAGYRRPQGKILGD
ncbi:MAG: nitric oxide synthase oxygenase, partial [Verrucomicrobiales bacterium]